MPTPVTPPQPATPGVKPASPAAAPQSQAVFTQLKPDNPLPVPSAPKIVQPGTPTPQTPPAPTQQKAIYSTPAAAPANPSTPNPSIPTPVSVIKPGTPTVQVSQNGVVTPLGAKPAVPQTNVPQAMPKPVTVPAAAPAAAPAGKSVTATPIVQTSTGAPAGAGVKPAVARPEVKKPPFLLFALIGALILGVVGFFLFNSSNSSSSSSTSSTTKTGGEAATGAAAKPAKQTTLIYWGLWEPTEVMEQVIAEFESAHPEYKIDYRKQSHKDYRERLQTAIASGNGPDLFRFHASWVPMLQDELTSVPTNVISPSDFQKNYYPVAKEQLTLDNKIVGVPLMYDGLSLYYNKEMLQAANVEPPKTWAELKALADSLTVPSNKAERGRGTLQRAGLAIGNATNVEHFSDIFGLLVLQNGGDLAEPNSTEVRDALLFYTNFVKEDKVWSDAMPSSTVAFARGDVAMMFAPSWRALDIKAMNPDLDFGVAPLPQLSDERLTWASYWAEGVNAKSKNQAGAWTFLQFLSQAENLEKFYSAASQARAFGEPFPRTDMASALSTDPILGALLSDAPAAKSWYLNSFTHDNGLNDQLIKYYGDAINATLDGTTIEEVLEKLDAGVTQVLRQYNAQ